LYISCSICTALTRIHQPSSAIRSASTRWGKAFAYSENEDVAFKVLALEVLLEKPREPGIPGCSSLRMEAQKVRGRDRRNSVLAPPSSLDFVADRHIVRQFYEAGN
jgi:hypothetical protein